MVSLFKEFEYLDYKFPPPQYLGSKYRFRSWIGGFIPPSVKTIIDAFGGSQSMAYYFKQLGYRVLTNDLMSYSDMIGKSLVENKSEVISDDDLSILLGPNPDIQQFDLMQRVFTGIFFKEEDAVFIDSVRGNIECLANGWKKALALSAMNRALTRKVTMGHFAHTQALIYANDANRIKRNRSLVRPIRDLFLELLPQYNAAVFDNGQDSLSHRGDAAEFVGDCKNVDLVYFDPPYGNSHSDYQQFYHLIETYTEYWKDKSFINGVRRYAPKRSTAFDQKSTIIDALDCLFQSADKIPYWLISYNDRSFPDVDTLSEMVGQYRRIRVERCLYKESRGGKGSVAGSSEILIIGEPK